MFRKYVYTAAILIISAFLMISCTKDNNPIKPDDTDHDHAEAAGFVITSGNSEIVRYEEGVVTGSFTLIKDSTSALYRIQFIAEDGDLFTPIGAEHTFAWTIGNASILELAATITNSNWSFTLTGQETGTTTIIFRILHGGHDDFVSLPVTVTVNVN